MDAEREKMEIDIEQLTRKAFNSIIREAAKQVIVEKVVYGIESLLKETIVEEANRLIREDSEIKDLLKERLKYWLINQ